MILQTDFLGYCFEACVSGRVGVAWVSCETIQLITGKQQKGQVSLMGTRIH